MSAEPATSAKAASSFRLGVWALFLSVFTGLPAIVQGFRGLREIARDPERLRGRGRAWAGIGLGLFGTTLGAYLLMLAVERVQESADRTH
jgi:hypothetical protein